MGTRGMGRTMSSWFSWLWFRQWRQMGQGEGRGRLQGAPAHPPAHNPACHIPEGGGTHCLSCYSRRQAVGSTKEHLAELTKQTAH